MAVSQEEFIDVFLDLLQRDDPVSADTELADIPEWDSMAIMAVMAYADKKHGKTLMLDDLKPVGTVAELHKLICQD